MEGAVMQRDRDVHHGIAERTLPRRLLRRVADGRDELAGDGTADDAVIARLIKIGAMSGN